MFIPVLEAAFSSRLSARSGLYQAEICSAFIRWIVSIFSIVYSIKQQYYIFGVGFSISKDDWKIKLQKLLNNQPWKKAGLKKKVIVSTYIFKKEVNFHYTCVLLIIFWRVTDW